MIPDSRSHGFSHWTGDKRWIFLQKRGMKRVFHVGMKCGQLLTIVNNG